MDLSEDLDAVDNSHDHNKSEYVDGDDVFVAEVEDDGNCDDHFNWVPEAEASEPDDDDHHQWSIVGLPSFLEDARRETTALFDERQQGGLSKVKPRAGDADVSGQGFHFHAAGRAVMPEGSAVSKADAAEFVCLIVQMSSRGPA